MVQIRFRDARIVCFEQGVGLDDLTDLVGFF